MEEGEDWWRLVEVGGGRWRLMLWAGALVQTVVVI